MLGIQTIRHILVGVNQTVSNLGASVDATRKTVVTTVGATSFAKGAVDIAEDLVCQDYVCLTVDCIGVTCDLLTTFTSFVPGPNVTSVVTIPVSFGCKTFRWCCTKSMLSIGCKR